jgi:hypothetical protein
MDSECQRKTLFTGEIPAADRPSEAPNQQPSPANSYRCAHVNPWNGSWDETAQRFAAVQEVLDGVAVTEVARRCGVSRPAAIARPAHLRVCQVAPILLRLPRQRDTAAPPVVGRGFSIFRHIDRACSTSDALVTRARFRPLTNGNPTRLRIDVASRSDCRGDRVKPALSIELAVEVPGMLVVRRIAVAGSPLTVRAPPDTADRVYVARFAQSVTSHRRIAAES